MSSTKKRVTSAAVTMAILAICAAIAVACHGTGAISCVTDDTAQTGAITATAYVVDAPSGSTSVLSAYIKAGTSGLSIDHSLYESGSVVQGVKDTPVVNGQKIPISVSFSDHATGDAVLIVHQTTKNKKGKIISDNTSQVPGIISCTIVHPQPPPAPTPVPTPTPVINTPPPVPTPTPVVKKHPRPQPPLTGKIEKFMPRRVGFMQEFTSLVKYQNTSARGQKVILRDMPQAGMLTRPNGSTVPWKRTIILPAHKTFKWFVSMRPTVAAANRYINNCASATIIRGGKVIRVYVTCARTYEPPKAQDLGLFTPKS